MSNLEKRIEKAAKMFSGFEQGCSVNFSHQKVLKMLDNALIKRRKEVGADKNLLAILKDFYKIRARKINGL